MRALLLAAALVTVLFAAFAATGTTADAAGEHPAAALEAAAPDLQGEAVGGGDDVVDVQVWTLVAAGGAAAVLLLLLLVRVAMGWVQTPPPQDGGPH